MNHLRNNQGSAALILALFVSLVLGAISVGLLHLAHQKNQLEQRLYEREESFYASELTMLSERAYRGQPTDQTTKNRPVQILDGAGVSVVRRYRDDLLKGKYSFDTTTKRHVYCGEAQFREGHYIPPTCFSSKEECIAPPAPPVTEESQLNVVFLQDKCALGLCSPGNDNDSGVIYDRCFKDGNTYLQLYNQQQPTDRYIVWPPDVEKYKIPVFKGERVIFIPSLSESQTNRVEMTINSKDWNHQPLWTLFAAITDQGVHSSTKMPPGASNKVLKGCNNNSCYVEFTIPITKDGYLSFKPNEMVHQYQILIIQHIFNPSGTLGPPPACNEPPDAARIGFIASKMPSCAQRVRDAMEGKAPWKNE